MEKQYIKFLVMPIVIAAIIVFFSFGNVHAATSSSDCLSSNQFSIINIGWGSTTSPVQAGPGSRDMPLTITLFNNNVGCSVQFANVSVGSIIEGIPAIFTVVSNGGLKYDLESDIPPVSSEPVTFYLDIAGNASLGDYSLPLKIVYSNSTTTYTEYLEANVQVLGISNIVVSFTNSSAADDLTSGQLNNVSIVFTNTGTGNASNISTSISSSSGTILKEIPDINSLAAGASVVEHFEILMSSSSISSAALSFSMDYTDAYQQPATQSQTLEFLVQSPIDIALATSTLLPATPSAGVPFSLTVTLANEGIGGADNVEAIPQMLPGFTSLGDAVMSVGDLSSGDSTTLTLTIITNSSLKAGTYVIPINVTYDNSLDQVKSEEINIPVTISASNGKNATSTVVSTTSNTSKSSSSLLSTKNIMIIGVSVVVILAAIILSFMLLKSGRDKRKNKK